MDVGDGIDEGEYPLVLEGLLRLGALLNVVFEVSLLGVCELNSVFRYLEASDDASVIAKSIVYLALVMQKSLVVVVDAICNIGFVLIGRVFNVMFLLP